MRDILKPALLAAVVATAALAGALGAGALDEKELPEVIALDARAVSAVPAERKGADPDERPVGPEEARRAERAALEQTGGGVVTELDRSDDPGESYEVEVVKDGREHDVALDLDFRPVPNRRHDD